MKSDTKQNCAKRLARIEGQVRGIARMVGEDRYCIDVVHQLQAVRSALKRVEEQVLKDHLATCVEGAIQGGDPDHQRDMMRELIEVLGRT